MSLCHNVVRLERASVPRRAVKNVTNTPVRYSALLANHWSSGCDTHRSSTPTWTVAYDDPCWEIAVSNCSQTISNAGGSPVRSGSVVSHLWRIVSHCSPGSPSFRSTGSLSYIYTSRRKRPHVGKVDRDRTGFEQLIQVVVVTGGPALVDRPDFFEEYLLDIVRLKIELDHNLRWSCVVYEL